MKMGCIVKCNKCHGTCSHAHQIWTMRPRLWMRGNQLAGRSLHCPFLLAEETILTRLFKKKAEGRGNCSLGIAWNSGVFVLKCPMSNRGSVINPMAFLNPGPQPKSLASLSNSNNTGAFRSGKSAGRASYQFVFQRKASNGCGKNTSRTFAITI